MKQWQGVMKHHAKSFYWASLFFPRELFPKVKALYALCRYLDDAVDEAPNEKEARRNLALIAADVNSSHPQDEPIRIYRHNGLKPGYINDLISGAQDDLGPVRIKNEVELIQYSYKVAGTVGLAMFDLMEIPNPQARAHAVDLGIAMQITNICRDVKEDLMKNRIYLPLSVLRRHQLSEQALVSGNFAEDQIKGVVNEMLKLADRYYASAEMAFPSIPFRTRGAIIIASRLYRGIGQKLKRQGSNPFLGRVYLNPWEKSVVTMVACWQWLLSGFKTKGLEHDPLLHEGLQTWGKQRGFLS